MSRQRFDGKIAFVTGAASGIGHACAKALADEGATVIVADRSADGEKVAAAIDRALFFRLDVGDTAGWENAASFVKERCGRLDVLINSAAITRGGEAFNVANATDEVIEETLAVNLKGAWAGIRVMLPLLEAAQGAIVNIASRAAEVGVPDAPAYGASKAAMVSLTRSTALLSARRKSGVRCNAVLPGSVDTPMWRPLSGGGKSREEAIAAGLPHIPLNRLATAQEIAAPVLFLASGEASYITGTTLLVDGGQSCL